MSPAALRVTVQAMREGRPNRGRAATDRAGDVRTGTSPSDGPGDWQLQADSDEAAASEARACYREHGLEPLEPDDAIRGLLGPGEKVLAVRYGVALDRRIGSARVSVIDSIQGDLYVTSDRLVHVGSQAVSFDLSEIEDSALVGEKVLLVLRDGVGVAFDADHPRLLRVQIGAARTVAASLVEDRGRSFRRNRGSGSLLRRDS